MDKEIPECSSSIPTQWVLRRLISLNWVNRGCRHGSVGKILAVQTRGCELRVSRLNPKLGMTSLSSNHNAVLVARQTDPRGSPAG